MILTGGFDPGLLKMETRGFLICEYSEMGAKDVETEVIAAPSNGESLLFCLGITLLHGG